MVTIREIITDPIYVLSTVIVLYILVLLTLYLVEKKLKKKKTEYDLDTNNEYYKQALVRIKRSEKGTEEKLENLKRLTREFAQERYFVEKNTDYTEIEQLVRQKGALLFADVIAKITEASYSGEKINERKLENLIKEFFEFIKIKSSDALEKREALLAAAQINEKAKAALTAPPKAQEFTRENYLWCKGAIARGLSLAMVKDLLKNYERKEEVIHMYKMMIEKEKGKSNQGNHL